MNFIKKLFKPKKKKALFDPTKYFEIDKPKFPLLTAAAGADTRVILNGELVPEAFFFGFQAKRDEAKGAMRLYYFSECLTQIKDGDNIDIEIAFEYGNTIVHHFQNVTVENEWGTFSKDDLAIYRNVEFSAEKMESELIKDTPEKCSCAECRCQREE